MNAAVIRLLVERRAVDLAPDGPIHVVRTSL
jgi:hypothetical protein